jgi:murein DD-endopeptidase MepM/ murein hydrolase activator NlpD
VQIVRASALLLFLCPAAGWSAPWAVVFPQRVEPGGVFEIKAGDKDRAIDGGSVLFAGQTTLLNTERGVPRALAGVPASTRAGKYPVTVTLSGGDVLHASVTVTAKRFPTQNVRMAASKTGLMEPRVLERERIALDAVLDTRSPRPLWQGSFIVPAAGRSTSAWGRRRTVNGRPWGQHQGADIAAPAGAAVRATNAGTVVMATRLAMRGNTVVIDHGFGVFSLYNHLSRIDVSSGQTLRRGQPIGLVGATGFASGPHLHWEIRIGRISVNPWPIVRWGLPLG